MKLLEIFEAASVSATDEDARMDAIVTTLTKAGDTVRRYDRISDPRAFSENPMVKDLLDQEGSQVLPITFVDGVLVKQGGYPTNQEMARWFGITEAAGCCASKTSCAGGCGGCHA
ncbi:MAG: arsenic metallochaperone ArsD family protein [Eubacterium sp.]|nr:arsenic metallochaperone ArsD family protein [Eubacterium sp.]